jgi:hypothetical protein
MKKVIIIGSFIISSLAAAETLNRHTNEQEARLAAAESKTGIECVKADKSLEMKLVKSGLSYQLIRTDRLGNAVSFDNLECTVINTNATCGSSDGDIAVVFRSGALGEIVREGIQTVVRSRPLVQVDLLLRKTKQAQRAEFDQAIPECKTL